MSFAEFNLGWPRMAESRLIDRGSVTRNRWPLDREVA